MANESDFKTNVKPTWCPGCGNFGIWSAVQKALAELGRKPYEVAFAFDIGCCGNGANWHNGYVFHSLHGRSLPVAYGIKLTNPRLTVIADAGDGAAYGEGTNHFLGACRGNIDIVYIVHNNHSYSLTKGQASPTTAQGRKTVSTPDGLIERPLNSLQLAITAGATFVAQGYSDDIQHLKELIKQAINHRGFALIDVIQPCVIFNDPDIRQQYQKMIYKLDSGYQPNDKIKAYRKAGETKKLPIGVIYQEKTPTYSDHLKYLKGNGVANQVVKKRSIKKLLSQFR